MQQETLRAQITLLLRQLNDWTHPARLPPELLCEIFADIYPNQPGKRTSQGVFTAAQVCHHWREVALESHQLWTHIELDRSEDYIRMMFDRSQRCLLEFTYSEHHAGNPKYHLVWSQIHRARSVVFSCSPDNCHLPLKKLHAPNLETFIEKFDFTTNSPLLPLLDVPRLRRAVVLAPSTPATHSLTSLAQLEILWVEGQPFNPPLEDVLATLGSLPSLSSLRIAIQFDLRADNPRVPKSCPIVPLKKLETLEFGAGCDVVGAAFFLNHTEIPHHARVSSRADMGNANFNIPAIKHLMYGSTMTVLQRFCGAHALTGLRLELRELSHNKGLSLSVSATTDEPQERFWHSSTQQELPFAVTLPYRPEAYPALTPLLSDLRSLTISVHWKPADLEGLHGMLGTLDMMETVTLYNERSRFDRKSQLAFLDVDAFFTAPSGRAHFPRLATLRLASIELEGGPLCMYCAGISINDWGFSGHCACGTHYPRLVTWLANRCDAGMPLARVVFEQCSDLGAKRKAELQSLVTREIVEIDNASSRRHKQSLR